MEIKLVDLAVIADFEPVPLHNILSITHLIFSCYNKDAFLVAPVPSFKNGSGKTLQK